MASGPARPVPHRPSCLLHIPPSPRSLAMAGARGGVASTRGSRAASRQQATVSSSSPAPPAPPATPRQPQPPPSAQASSSKEGMKTRQKRVLPTRSRRGGPGVGTCETDVMILDTMKRKGAPRAPVSSPPSALYLDVATQRKASRLSPRRRSSCSQRTRRCSLPWRSRSRRS